MQFDVHKGSTAIIENFRVLLQNGENLLITVFYQKNNLHGGIRDFSPFCIPSIDTNKISFRSLSICSSGSCPLSKRAYKMVVLCWSPQQKCWFFCLDLTKVLIELCLIEDMHWACPWLSWKSQPELNWWPLSALKSWDNYLAGSKPDVVVTDIKTIIHVETLLCTLKHPCKNKPMWDNIHCPPT